jgi:23S rRNA pseudouridine1911/1915/1917 synthase
MGIDVKTASFVIPETVANGRADLILTELMGGAYSRSCLTRLIKQKAVLVDSVAVRPSTTIRPGQLVQILEPDPEISSNREISTPPNFSIIFEDDYIIVVDKPAGLAVHPGARRPDGTLMDMIVSGRPEMVGVGQEGRWGIVHRLDRDTSGVMVVAKNQQSYDSLSKQFKEHSMKRIYLAIVRGNPGADSGVVDVPIGRNPHDRKRISVSTNKGRSATTIWNVVNRLLGFCLLEIYPKTGRTHQIRVHLASAGLPVLGDTVYGRLRHAPRNKDSWPAEGLNVMKRQALHAHTLAIVHPQSGAVRKFCSPLPEDMEKFLRLAAIEDSR